MTCTEEEKVQWFKDTVGDTIAKVHLQGDRVEEIIVVDQLYDCASEALANMPLPASFPDQSSNGISKEQLEADFAAYCKSLVIRTATYEQLAVANDDVSPELIFIRVLTRGMKIHGFIESWDKQIGFSDGLKGVGCPFEFSFEEKKLLFGLSYLMSCMSSSSQEPAQPEMYKM